MNLVQRAQPLLGTLTQISARAARGASDLNAAVAAAFAKIATVHALMSWHDPASDVSRLNRFANESEQPVDVHTRTVLAAALNFARMSHGAFDPSVATTLAHWGLLPLPVRASPEIPGHSSWQDIELSPRGVRFHRPLWLDLGGIAKGYAVDLALQCLLDHGVAEVSVNAGGDLRVAGAREYPIAIRHPRHGGLLAHEISLRNEALATSSAFASRRDTGGASVCALVDPATRNAYSASDSVSVRAANCMTADALTKVALFAPAPIAESVFEQCGALCIRLTPETADS